MVFNSKSWLKKKSIKIAISLVYFTSRIPLKSILKNVKKLLVVLMRQLVMLMLSMIKYFYEVNVTCDIMKRLTKIWLHIIHALLSHREIVVSISCETDYSPRTYNIVLISSKWGYGSFKLWLKIGSIWNRDLIIKAFRKIILFLWNFGVQKWVIESNFSN